jgi:hypothetical protein
VLRFTESKKQNFFFKFAGLMEPMPSFLNLEFGEVAIERTKDRFIQGTE